MRSFESVSTGQLFAEALKIKAIVSRLLFAFIFYILKGQLSNEGEKYSQEKKEWETTVGFGFSQVKGF